jgi:signal transduction histidine kinase/DNA-binding response OmpR family regulator
MKLTMKPPQLRAALPWLTRLSLIASLLCLALALYLGLVTRTGAIQNATRDMAVRADTLARQIEADLAQFDLALHEAANQAARDNNPTAAKASFPELPLTAQYLGFMNVLNEVGDVVADSRSNVSRPVNFAGRDYFQDHLKNPADRLMIGRPFATAPNQRASIPISRRLNRPDGAFAGVVVAGVHLAWLSDLLSHPFSGPRVSVTVRREDGVILMRAPADPDAIGRGDADPAWQAFLRTGLSPATDDPAGIRLFRRLGGAPLVLDLTLARADIAAGQPNWLVLLPLLAGIPGLCVIGLSILTRQLMRRVNQVDAAARAANDEDMRLLANMSHELRTPLTGILGQAELMAEEGGLTDSQMTRLTRLTEAGALMRGIVNRVIEVARPDDRADAPVLEPCDLDHLIRTCLGMVEGEARRKGLRLTSTIDPSIPRRRMLARDLVQQVMVNLLMNAVKFTTEGTVSVRVTGDSLHLWFEVADTGPGIPARKRRRLFREYDRLDLPDSRAESTGLGLSITERFVLRMGGRIGSIERPGGGSVFWFELPSTEPDQASIVAAEAAHPAPVPEIRHLRILLADDLDLTRNVTAEYLRSAGHAVIEVSDGETAIAEVQKQDFDVVLTDMRMPIVDGLEVARRIRALPGHRGRTPVVLVTADLVAIGRGKSGQTGVDVCVTKPFTRAELLTAVATAARLTPVTGLDPSAVASDAITLSTLKRGMDDGAFAAQIDAVTHRIEALLKLLEAPGAAESLTLRDAVHDLVGIAGLLELTAFGACLRLFDTATDRAAHAPALRDAATAALRTLRQPEPTALHLPS